MRICVCGPFNPQSIRAYLYSGQEIPSINTSASSVNIYVLELLRSGHTVIAITAAIPGVSKDIVLKGDKLIVHVVHSNPGLWFSHAFSRFYMVKRIKKVISEYISQVDVIHAQWTYDFALAAKSFSKMIPVFCTVRDWCPYIISVQKGWRKIQWYAYYMIFRMVMDDDFIHFIANSEYTYHCVKKAYPSKNVSVIYNPIDKHLILSKKEISIQEPTFISIASSLVEDRKNIDTLIQAFHLFHKKHHNSQLKLVGAGEDIIVKKYSQAMLDGIDFCGLLGHDELIDNIDMCTCLVHPSLEETFGNILLEGMARHVAVIGGQNSGAVPIVLEGGKSGILCDITDANSIEEAMEQSCNEEFTKGILAMATVSLYEKYSSYVIVEKHIELYSQYVID